MKKNKRSMTMIFFAVFVLLIEAYRNKKLMKNAGFLEKKVGQLQGKKERLDTYYDLLVNWIKCGKIIWADILNTYGAGRVAIYGMGELGELLYDALSKENIIPEYIIDTNPNSYYVIKHNSETKILAGSNVDITKKDVDMIIVTPVFQFDTIKDNLSGQTDCTIVSLKEILEVAESERYS